MLNARGMLIGDLTVANLSSEGDERFWIFGNMATEMLHQRWFQQHAPDGVTIRLLTNDILGLSIAGPKARAVLQSLCDDDLSNDSFPFRSFQKLQIGLAQAWVGRMTFSGELGYELWMDPRDQLHLFDTLMAAGAEHGIRLFGNRAILNMRLEKGWGAWGMGDFIGRDAFIEQQANGGDEKRLILLAVDSEIDCHHDEPIWHKGEVIGWITSGGFGHTVGLSLAMGYVPKALADDDLFEVEILGERYPARRLAEAPCDPQGLRMRA
jgi:dimethylglycine dehydrogenase